MASNVTLPEGFVLDEPTKNENSLPEGFVLDTQPQTVSTPKPYKKALEQEPVNYKQNVDTLYNIPQVDMPQRGTLTNSDGKMLYTQEATNQAYQQVQNNPNLTKEQKIAEIQRIGAERNKQIDKENRQNMARIGLGATLQGASMHPIFNIPYVGTGLGGALFDAGSAIVEGKKGGDIAKQAGRGFVIGETIGAIPYVGKAIGRTKAGQAVANKVINSGVGRSVQQGAEKFAKSKAGQELFKERTIGRAKPQVADEIIENIPHELKTEAKIVGAEGADIPVVKEVEQITPTQAVEEVATPQKIEEVVTEAPEIQKLTKVSMTKDRNAQLRQIKNEIEIPEITKGTYIQGRYKNRYFTKNVTDDLTQGFIDADTVLANEIKAIKKNPEIINTENYLENAEARLMEKIESLPEEAQAEYFEKFYNAFEKADNYNALKSKPITPEELGFIEDIPQATKQRGAVETVRKNFGDDVANQITDNAYSVRGREVLQNEYNQLTPEAKQALLNTDEIDDLSVFTKAQFIKDSIANGEIPVAKLNQWASEGTKQGQALQARSFLAPDTVEGAVAQAINHINKAQPKNVQKIVEDIPKIVDKVQKELTPEQKLKAIENMLKTRVINKGKRKTLADKILRLEDLGGMNEENLTKLINKEFKIPELNSNDLAKFEELTSNIRNTQGYDKDVAIQQLAKYITSKTPASKMSKLKTYRNIALLLNPKTLGRNIVGNAVFNALDTGAKALAYPIDRALGKFTGLNTRALPQLGASFEGGLQGTKRGFQEALQGIDTRGLGQRFDLGQGRQLESKLGQGAETLLDIGLRVPDRTFYEGAFAESVANQLKAQGLAQPTEEILQRAEQEALEAVFQNSGKISDLALKARQGLNTIGTKEFGLGDLLIPYAQTPANLVQQGINYSPLGLAKAGMNLAKGDQRQASLDIARSLLGTGLIGGGYELGKRGLATPSQFADNYFENQKLKENYELLGIRPDQLGNAWYAPFQPISSPISAGVAMSQGENPVSAGFNTIIDLPFLQSTTKLMKDIQEGDLVKAGTNFVAGVPTQFIPTALSQVAQYYDPYLRETYDENKIMQGLNQALNKIPVGRTALPIKYNVKGEPKTTTSTSEHPIYDTFLNPTFINKPIDDEVVRNLKTLQEQTGETAQLLPVPSKKLSFVDSEGNKQKITLNNRQLSEYQRLLGSRTYNDIADLMQTEEYIYAEPEQQVKMIQKVKNNTKNEVENLLFNRRIGRKRR